MSMLTLKLNEELHLKGRYSIGNVGRTASRRKLTLFESRYTVKTKKYSIGR